MKKSLSLLLTLGTLGQAAFAASVTWDNNSTNTWTPGVATSGGGTYSNGDTMIFDGTTGTIQTGTVAPAGIQTTSNAEVRLEGGTLTNSSGLTLSGEAGTSPSLSIASNISGTGNITVSSGHVAFSGQRQETAGTITISSGATLDARGGRLFHGTTYSGNGSVHINGGTLIVDSLQYGTGNLGTLKDNTGSLVMNGNNSTVSIQDSGSATIGLELNGWGNNYYIKLADGKNFTWKSSDHGALSTTHDGSGNGLHFVVGTGSTFTMEKALAGGINIQKEGEGEMVLNATTAFTGGRVFYVNGGTLSLGVDEALGAQAGLGDISVSGSATLDLKGHISYNKIILAAGGTILNGQNNRGTVSLAITDADQNKTTLTSEQLANIGGTLSSTGILELLLEEDLACTQSADMPSWYTGGGRLSGNGGVEISGTSAENVSLSGYTSAQGAVSSSDGSIAITGVQDVIFRDNHATTGTTDAYEDFFRAGALAAGDSVSVEASGNITFAGNSVTVNHEGGGAIYASNDVVLTAGETMTFSGNTAGISESGEESISGGAIRSLMGNIDLTANQITISDNRSGGEGGALSAGLMGKLHAEGTLEATGNEATENGGLIYATDAVEITAGGDILIDGNSSGGYGGAIYTAGMGILDGQPEGVVVAVSSSQGSVQFSNNHAALAGGAIQTDYGVSLSGTSGTVILEGNSSDDNGGAVEAGSIILTGNGDTRITGNTAGNTGGAFSLLDGGTLTLEASRGNIDFTGNSDSTGANDITFQGAATANLTAGENQSIQMEGGMNSALDDVVSVLINANGGSGTVVLGGTSDLVADTSISGGTLRLKDGAVYGRETAANTFRASSASVTTNGQATIHTAQAELADTVAEGVTLTVSEQISLTNAELKGAHLIGTGESSTLTMEAARFTLSNASTLTETTTEVIAEGFSVVQGTVELQATEEFLQAVIAQGGALDIALFNADAQVGDAGLTVSISDSLSELLQNRYAVEEFGFIDANGELVNSLTLTSGQILSTLQSVEFKVTGLIPEPTTVTLSLLALAGLCLRRRRS